MYECVWGGDMCGKSKKIKSSSFLSSRKKMLGRQKQGKGVGQKGVMFHPSG